MLFETKTSQATQVDIAPLPPPESMMPQTETKEYLGAIIKTTRYDAQKLINDFWGEGSYSSLLTRKPDLEKEPDVSLTVITFPIDAVPDFHLGRTFQHITDEYREGNDMFGIGSGAVSGAKIAEYKKRMKESGYPFPTRREEYDDYVKAHSGENNNIWQFQGGGYPFNDGSIFYKAGECCAVQDHLLTERYKNSPFFGENVPFTGLAVYKDGTKKFVTLHLDTTSYETFKSGLEQIENLDTFIGTPISLVENGKALSDEEVFRQKTNSDPRHFIDLPYFGNPSLYGKNLSGSIFMEEFQDMLRQGKGPEIWEHMKNGEEMELEIYPDSRELIQAALSDSEGIKELERVGLNLEELRKVISDPQEKVHFLPQKALYNHLVLGMKDGRLAIATTSGLLEGVKSGKLGLPADILARLLEKEGFESAVFGCQGRDVLQVLCNGSPVSGMWDKNAEMYKEEIFGKEATTPSMVITYPAD